jgi:iron-sulfur cluster repair protein YtfE (RIC family)
VEDVSHQSPGALAILKARGINHCCGAHLTLREAAAAAGTPLEDLLETLAILEGNPA